MTTGDSYGLLLNFFDVWPENSSFDNFGIWRSELFFESIIDFEDYGPNPSFKVILRDAN